MDIIKRGMIEARKYGYNVEMDDIRMIHKEFCESGERDFLSYLIKWLWKRH